MALPQALHSPSSDLQTVDSSPLHNTQGVFSTRRGHWAVQWHSHSKPQSEQVFEVTQLHTMFPEIITHHSPCAFLKWHLLPRNSGTERWHLGVQDLMAYSESVEWRENMTQLICALIFWQPLCWLPKDTTARWRNRQIIWATQDRSAAFFSFHCTGINTCIIPPVYSTAFHHWNLPL